MFFVQFSNVPCLLRYLLCSNEIQFNQDQASVFNANSHFNALFYFENCSKTREKIMLARIKHLSDANTQLQDARTQQDAQIQHMSTSVSTLEPFKDLYAQIQSQYGTLQSQYASLEQIYKQSCEDLGKTILALNKAQEVLEQIKSKLGGVQDVEQLAALVGTLLKQKQDAQAKCTELEQALKQRDREMEITKRQLIELVTVAKQQRDDSKKKSQELQEAQDKILDLEQELRIAQKQLEIRRIGSPMSTPSTPHTPHTPTTPKSGSRMSVPLSALADITNFSK